MTGSEKRKVSRAGERQLVSSVKIVTIYSLLFYSEFGSFLKEARHCSVFAGMSSCSYIAGLRQVVSYVVIVAYSFERIQIQIVHHILDSN